MAKLTVEFSEKVNKMLLASAKRNGTTKADVLRRAIALYDHVDREVIHTPDRWLVVLGSDGVIEARVVIT